MIRHVTDDLYQIGEYVENEYGFEAIHIYVMLNDGRPILIDCGSHIHRESVMAELDEVVGDSVPEYIFLTHSELPHAGNIAAVAEKWPSIKVIVSNVMLPYIEVLPVLPLEQMTQVVPSTTIQSPTRTVEFLSALLKDQPGSHWIYDSRTQTIFTGDGFGYFVPESAVGALSDEISGGIATQWLADYHRVAFRFLQWIKPDRLNADLDTMFGNRPVSNIAPIHGGVIRGAEQVQVHLGRLKTALAAVNQAYWSEK